MRSRISSAIHVLASLALIASAFYAGCCLTPSSSGGGGDSNTPSDSNSPSGGDTTVPPDGPAPTSIAVEAIVKTGDAVPEQTGATFTYFGNPIIDEDGRVAFYAAYEGGTGDGGLYVWDNDTLERVYDTDPNRTGLITGLSDTDYLGGFSVSWNGGSPHLAWGSNGRLLYAAHVNDGPSPDALLRWRASDGDVFLVGSVSQLQAVITDATGDFLPEFYHPGVSDAGLAIFSSRYSYFRSGGSFALFQRGIFTTDGRTTEEIATGTVPANTSGATFDQPPVLLTSLNAGGEYLLQAAYSSGDGDRGVYLLSSGSLVRVVDNAPGRSFPGLPDGAQVGAAGENFEAIALSDRRQVAIDTTLTVGGSTRDTVLLWDKTEWHELQGSGGAYASDLLAGVTDDGRALYLADGKPYLSDGTTSVELSATLPTELEGVSIEWAGFGGAVNNSGHVLLRYQRSSTEPGLAFWSGEKLFVALDATSPIGLDPIDTIFPVERLAPDAVDRVGTISNRPEVNRPGLSGAVNDSDEFVFRAGYLGTDGQENTSDDVQAIFLGRGE